uniref:Uncharacterized protein n=1 Tax=Triticum urartu TaxID=4572 RepID=A0A8R7UXR8_TRIUA
MIWWCLRAETTYFHHQWPNPHRRRCCTALYPLTSSASRLPNMKTSSIDSGAEAELDEITDYREPGRFQWQDFCTITVADFSGKTFVQLQWQISEICRAHDLQEQDILSSHGYQQSVKQRNIHGRYTGIHKNVHRVALPFCH